MARDPFAKAAETKRQLMVGRPHIIIYFIDGTQRQITQIDSWYIKDNFLIVEYEDGKKINEAYINKGVIKLFHVEVYK